MEGTVSMLDSVTGAWVDFAGGLSRIEFSPAPRAAAELEQETAVVAVGRVSGSATVTGEGIRRLADALRAMAAAAADVDRAVFPGKTRGPYRGDPFARRGRGRG